MDILLINPPWMTKDGNIWHGVKSTSPPLGLLYVAAYAEDRGRTVHVMDVNAERLHFEDIERFVADHQPSWVGMTAVTAQIINTHRIAGIIKQVSSASKVVVGGVHATAMPDEVPGWATPEEGSWVRDPVSRICLPSPSALWLSSNW